MMTENEFMGCIILILSVGILLLMTAFIYFVVTPNI